MVTTSMTLSNEKSVRSTITPFISIIVPVFNEEAAIATFFSAIFDTLSDYPSDIEIIMVNDGSSDETKDKIIKQIKKYPCTRLICLSRNFGKEAALTAGIDYAKGDVVIPMDVDLQDPPELIMPMIDKWQNGFDVVYGVRASRNGDSLAKRLTANMFYRFFNWISDVSIPENVGDFRLMDRKVVNALKMFPERNRFMKGLFSWSGFKSTSVSYERCSRAKGESKWSYWRLWNFALDGLFSFSTVPLRIWSYIGAFISFLAFIYIGFLVLRVFISGIDVPGYASIMTVILFFGGIQLLSIGIIGEYIGRIFMETKTRPIYIVDSVHDSSRDNKTDS